jgi:50S ribosomal protein L16 3-hydroxylase
MFMGQNCRSLEKPMKKHDVPSVLGGISPQIFMRNYWQKKPLLIRQAIPGMQALLSRKDLFTLASNEDVESRLVSGDNDSQPWQLRRGPFKPRSLPPLSRPHWTLLVQGVDLHVDSFAQLRDRFRFIPDARLDDVMVSYASDGGGVGPHFDSYDVFLLQAQGQRRWRISAQKNLQLRDDVPLKILSQFKPTKTLLLEPGDMLYLPPHYAHEGVAVGECMTYSIGFRAPEMNELAAELLSRMTDSDNAKAPVRYRDAGQAVAVKPARIPATLQAFAMHSVQSLLSQSRQLQVALGEVLTDPKAEVWFAAQDCPRSLRSVRLDAKTRMLYDDQYVFINGESWRCQGADARSLRLLADERRLSGLDSISPPLSALLREWVQSGWLHSA